MLGGCIRGGQRAWLIEKDQMGAGSPGPVQFVQTCPACRNHIMPCHTPSPSPPLLPQAAATRAVKYGDELSFLEDASPEKRASAEEHM